METEKQFQKIGAVQQKLPSLKFCQKQVNLGKLYLLFPAWRISPINLFKFFIYHWTHPLADICKYKNILKDSVPCMVGVILPVSCLQLATSTTTTTLFFGEVWYLHSLWTCWPSVDMVSCQRPLSRWVAEKKQTCINFRPSVPLQRILSSHFLVEDKLFS